MAAIKYFDAPGSSAWTARRARCFNAGDASVMLACSTNKTRSQLLHEHHTGLDQEFSDYVRDRVIEPGHRIEELARPLAEQILGEDLQVLAATLAVDGLSRPLGASLDGSTFMEDTNWECKTLNDALRAAMPHAGRDSHELNEATALPKMYRAQMEQQQLVNGATKTLFTAALFNDDGTVQDERHAWYESDSALRAEIITGWKQFDADLAAYVPPEATPVLEIKTAASLPIVFDMRVEGKLVTCNLEQYKPAALAYIAKINTELATDQQFADAKVDAKFCRESADKLELAIEQALGQMGDINAAINTVREIAAAFDAKGLALEKKVESETKAIKERQVLRGQHGLKAHIDALNVRLGRSYMPTIDVDFAAAVKNKRTVDSLRDSVDSELARAKMAASDVADRIQINLNYMVEHASEHKALFPDTATIVLKAADDLQALVSTRINAHKEAEQKRLDAERERIRAEEQAKAEREARVKMAAEAQEAARQAAAAAATPAPNPAPAPIVQPTSVAPVPAPVANVVPLRVAAPVGAPATPPSLKLGQINERIAPLSIDAAGLAKLGFTAAATDRGAKLFHEQTYPHMLAAMVQHLEALQSKQAA